MAIQVRQIADPGMQVAFLMLKLSGRARMWSYGELTVDPPCLVSLEDIKSELRVVFEPPPSEFRMRVEFLNMRQGSMDINGNIQKAQYSVSRCVSAPIVKIYLFREYLETLEHAFPIVLREGFSVKRAKRRSYHARGSDSAEPIDLSAATAHHSGVRDGGRISRRPENRNDKHADAVNA